MADCMGDANVWQICHLSTVYCSPQHDLASYDYNHFCDCLFSSL